MLRVLATSSGTPVRAVSEPSVANAEPATTVRSKAIRILITVFQVSVEVITRSVRGAIDVRIQPSRVGSRLASVNL